MNILQVETKREWSHRFRNTFSSRATVWNLELVQSSNLISFLTEIGLPNHCWAPSIRNYAGRSNCYCDESAHLSLHMFSNIWNEIAGIIHSRIDIDVSR